MARNISYKLLRIIDDFQQSGCMFRLVCSYRMTNAIQGNLVSTYEYLADLKSKLW